MTKLFLPLFLLTNLHISVTSYTLNSQRSTLLSIKQQWGNPQSLSTWNPATSPCSWRGVECSIAKANSTRLVTGISLYKASINSSIPASVCELKGLKTLNLSWNNIPSGFPTTLGRCSALTTLDLSANLLVGPIPDDVDKLLPPSLQHLNLNENNFIGDVPKSIGALKELRTLNLGSNLLNGTYPFEISNLSKLEGLQMDTNPFTPMALPSEWGKLRNLKTLIMSGCNLVGQIPESFGTLLSLEHLDLSQNRLVGRIPHGLFLLESLSFLQMDTNPFTPMALPSEWGKLKNLKTLIMSGCNLVGQIPESFGTLLSLEHLDLSQNRLVGSIPHGLFLLESLSFLHLYTNKLSGEIPSSVHSLNLSTIDLYNNSLSGSIPEDFGKLRRLKDLTLFMNNLSGGIPASIGLLPELVSFQAYYNNLSGPLPPELGLHSKLRKFEIGRNRFSGPLPENLCSRGGLIGITAFSNHLSGGIPKSLGQCTTLTLLMINNNNFTGEIPTEVWTLPFINSLMLSFNDFTGSLPDKISENLTSLELNNNKFTGNIPNGIASWKNIQVFLAGNNFLSGTFPLGLLSLSGLQTLSLEGNELSGELPLDVSYSWPSLTKLNLGKNRFSGPIPGAIGLLPALNYLDLSSNGFSGEIPSQFEQMEVISFLNMSSNKLVGRIPYALDNGAFATSFLNNTNLCTSDKSQIITLVRCSSFRRPVPSNRLSSKHLAMIFVLVAVLFFVTLYCTAFAIKETEKRKYKGEQTSWKLTPFHTLSFTEDEIIPGLTEHHVIGSGASGFVYLVHVGNDSGYFVAVKKIWNNEKFDNAQFLAEVQILGDIRHANIVKLLCCISSEKSNLLVYEYMENRSLDRWLHRRKRLELESRGEPLHVLDWPTRLKIAIGIARGLSYMHHDCGWPILHRDMKSSNILLDSEFNAKIADFGLARMMMRQGELHTMSNVAGTFGYLAPEYRYTKKVNTKVDVYSFGVILLELVTGKVAHGEDESHVNLAEWSWKQSCEGASIVDVLDEEVVQQDCIEEMSMVFTLGLFCTNPLPNARPSMKDVLEVLCRRTRFEKDSWKSKMMGADHGIASVNMP